MDGPKKWDGIARQPARQKHIYQPVEIVARLERDAAARGMTIKDRLTEILDVVLPRTPGADSA